MNHGVLNAGARQSDVLWGHLIHHKAQVAHAMSLCRTNMPLSLPRRPACRAIRCSSNAVCRCRSSCRATALRLSALMNCNASAQINAQRESLVAQQQAAKAQQYASCTSQVRDCVSSCRDRFTGSVIGSGAKGVLDGVLSAVSAVTESEQCERQCRSSANCEALK